MESPLIRARKLEICNKIDTEKSASSDSENTRNSKNEFLNTVLNRENMR